MQTAEPITSLGSATPSVITNLWQRTSRQSAGIDGSAGAKSAPTDRLSRKLNRTAKSGRGTMMITIIICMSIGYCNKSTSITKSVPHFLAHREFPSFPSHSASSSSSFFSFFSYSRTGRQGKTRRLGITNVRFLEQFPSDPLRSCSSFFFPNHLTCGVNLGLVALLLFKYAPCRLLLHISPALLFHLHSSSSTRCTSIVFAHWIVAAVPISLS